MSSCGGSLVAPDIVLTAAHCDDRTGTQMVIGAYAPGNLGYGAQERFCEQWVPDPLYSDFHLSYDLALCKLDQPVEIDSHVTLEMNDDNSLLNGGDDLIVMGLGLLSDYSYEFPDVLQNVVVPYVTNEECNGENSYDGVITDDMFCAGFPETGGRDSCGGDSGGPIVKRTIKDDGSVVDTQVGVVSWGYGCAEKNFPGVYADISKRFDWIKTTMCDELESVASFCNNNNNDLVPQQDACDGMELTVEVTTDEYAYETSWVLYSLEHDTEITKREYMIDNHENVHKICLKPDECYSWELRDALGDGLCSYSGCGSYGISLDGTPLSSGDGSFTDFVDVFFCTKQ